MFHGMIGVRIARGNAEHKIVRLHYGRKQRQHAGATTSTTNRSREGAATGTQATLQQDTARSSNSETYMTSTCSRGQIQTEYNQVIEISTNYVKMSRSIQ